MQKGFLQFQLNHLNNLYFTLGELNMSPQPQKVMGSKDEKDKFELYYVDSSGFIQVIIAHSLEDAYGQILKNRENGS